MLRPSGASPRLPQLVDGLVQPPEEVGLPGHILSLNSFCVFVGWEVSVSLRR